MIIVAHQDDEAIGCASKILREKDTFIVYIITDNEIRKNEARMMALFTGIKKDNLIFLNYKSNDLLKRETTKELINNISVIIKKHKPSEIYIPAYEGGNFFHDLTNYSVNKAVEKNNLDVKLYEFPLYNNYPRYILQKVARRLSLYLPIPHKYPQRFIPIKGLRVMKVNMTKEEMVLKKHMLRIYKSQNKNDLLVKMFWYPEKYRENPRYDYRKKPHVGLLNYELTTKLSFKNFQEIIK